ncbi:helix-turn-helix domain-containing protein [Pseudomonas stutzeri]|uniref:AraC family transcriptional regulator n=1 Tax=Stutzerimonas stutzeri KOS6 TaxID=1218352 RepID=A0A061JSM3_STUST|nr:AraC family transcriptional regulator [Stutzerimonas stutzeri]EWC42712.1 AraC family transcriptional regulator [Stutzerimonas stutzeri KOS6]MBK3866668.1 helix-turn-helix domain-containing protein [Stutzerimonas stutzeri]
MNDPDDSQPRFWRDAALPFIEARAVADGRKVCYAPHCHETFSIGAITAGASTYINGTARQRIAQGAVVIINPQTVHACNPIDGQPWSYLMFYVDTHWLGTLQHELGANRDGRFIPYAPIQSVERGLFNGLVRLYATLLDPQTDTLQRQSVAVEYFTRLQQTLAPTDATLGAEPIEQLQRAAAYIAEHCTQALRLEDICQAAGLSPSYLIRTFKQHYGMTPHAYLLNRRIQRSQHWLRQGHDLAEVALAAGFADQAHFQRTFKRQLAATPGQYRDRVATGSARH